MIKRIICLSFVILFGFAAGIATAKYSGGDGSESTPYRISDANDMNEIGTHSEDWGAHFILVNDINLAEYTGEEFNIIGYFVSPSNEEPFSGFFDGNGHTITNFTYTTTRICAGGLFGYIDSSGEIKNLTMQNATVGTSGLYLGALVGYNNGGTISNCSATGNIVGNHYTGGLVGWNCIGGTISNCNTSFTVEGKENTGGMVGTNQGAILSCYATGVVSASIDGEVIGPSIGGLVGVNHDGTISNCYATSAVGGNNRTGGLVGANYFGTIENSYANGDVSGNIYAGGLVGYNYESIISYCYAAGVVDGNDNIGLLVGYEDGSSYVKCFWDSDINPDVNGIGNTTDPNVIGKSTAEMQTETTFTSVGWDFIEIWNIGENQTYPYLRVYPAGDSNHDGRVDGRDLAIIAMRWLDGI